MQLGSSDLDKKSQKNTTNTFQIVKKDTKKLDPSPINEKKIFYFPSMNKFIVEDDKSDTDNIPIPHIYSEDNLKIRKNIKSESFTNFSKNSKTEKPICSDSPTKNKKLPLSFSKFQNKGRTYEQLKLSTLSKIDNQETTIPIEHSEHVFRKKVLAKTQRNNYIEYNDSFAMLNKKLPSLELTRPNENKNLGLKNKTRIKSMNYTMLTCNSIELNKNIFLELDKIKIFKLYFIHNNIDHVLARMNAFLVKRKNYTGGRHKKMVIRKASKQKLNSKDQF